MKIKKWQIISILKAFKENNCKTIDDAIDDLNKNLKDTDIAFTIKVEKTTKGSE